MNFTPAFAMLAPLAYLIGAVPFGVVLSLVVVKKDVRQHGSGNIGATNVSRLMGKKWGVVVLLLDALKGFAIVKVGAHLQLPSPEVYALGILAVVGHCFPIYLKFKGGKGVATALGVITALSPFATGVCVGAFAIVLALSRIISASSLSAGLALVLLSAISPSAFSFPAATVLCVLVWYKHKENIIRLIRKQEPRFF